MNLQELVQKKREIENMKIEDEKNLRSIRGVRRSRRRDPLNEAVNERLDKIEIALSDGQYISDEDWKFVLQHDGRDGDYRRTILMQMAQEKHFKLRQQEIEGRTTAKLPHLRTEAEIEANNQKIDSLEGELKAEINAFDKSEKAIKGTIEETKRRTRRSQVRNSSIKIRNAYRDRDQNRAVQAERGT